MKKGKHREILGQQSDIVIVSKYPNPLMGFAML